MMKNILLFTIPFALVAVGVIGYFKLNEKLSAIDIPNLPALSFSDLTKFSKFSLEKAPSQSLVGKITSMSGEVLYEDRTATEAAKINSAVSVQQGEGLTTGEDGNVILTFEKSVEVNMFSHTSVSIIQTLPANIVFLQGSGEAEYKKLGEIPVSIRTRRLLIENNGDITVTMDSIDPIVTVKVNSGVATFAYNDLDVVSQVLTVEEGKTLTFNESTRKVALE